MIITVRLLQVKSFKLYKETLKSLNYVFSLPDFYNGNGTGSL